MNISNRYDRQEAIVEWGVRAFGANMAAPDRRAIRLCEETFEVAQAIGLPKDQVHALLDYVYAKPVGDIKTELGDVGICLMALASSLNLNMDMVERIRVEEILTKDPAIYTARMETKKKAGF